MDGRKNMTIGMNDFIRFILNMTIGMNDLIRFVCGNLFLNWNLEGIEEADACLCAFVLLCFCVHES